MADKQGFKIPKSIGACADRLYQCQNERYELQKLVDNLKEEETALKDHIINTLPKSEASGVSGKLARVSVYTKPVPQAKDWSKIYAYIKKTGSFDLLQRRLAEKAISDRFEAGKKIPGVEIFNAVAVSINKL